MRTNDVYTHNLILSLDDVTLKDASITLTLLLQSKNWMLVPSRLNICVFPREAHCVAYRQSFVRKTFGEQGSMSAFAGQKTY